MIPINIDDMKKIELEITDEIHRICSEHGLTYFLAYGSLIGAARHGGFIPWDDDMDLHMFRQNYDTFILHFDEWKSNSRFAILSPVLGNSPYAMTKVYDTTTYVKQSYVHPDYSTGVWVDIFPLDYYQPGSNQKFKQIARLNSWRYIASMDPRTPSASKLVSLGKKAIFPLAKRLNATRIATKMDCIAKEMFTNQTGYYAKIPGAVSPEDYYFEESWFKPVLMAFENREYFAPKEYDKLLTNLYGEWKVPVPEERHTAEAYRI